MKILAIETSCDETAAAVIEGYPRILSSILASQAKKQARFGGVVPEVAAREHVTVIIPIIKLALAEARTKLKDIDFIAVTQGPGLATSLMVGVDTAKALGAALNIPVIPINHLEGHIYANFIESKKSKVKSQNFPALILTVSGGHTMLVEMKGHGKYRILGETLDDAAGEAFDKTARMLGLGYPGGVQLSKLAEKGNPQAFNFPRPMINSGNFEFSFSGLKTAVLYTIRDFARSPASTSRRRGESKKPYSSVKADIAASVQQAIVDVLMAKLEKAIQRYKPKTIMLGGGVAANNLLRKRFEQLAKTSNLQSLIPHLQYCTDNAAMIGLAAYYKIRNKKFSIKNFRVNPNLKLK